MVLRLVGVLLLLLRMVGFGWRVEDMQIAKSTIGVS